MVDVANSAEAICELSCAGDRACSLSSTTIHAGKQLLVLLQHSWKLYRTVVERHKYVQAGTG